MPAPYTVITPPQSAEASRPATATLRAYRADWRHFTQWCQAHGLPPLPAAPATVGAYLASLSESHAPASIRRRLSALGRMHRFNDLPWDPAHRDIRDRLHGLLRRPGRAARRAAITPPVLRQLVATCGDDARGRRDRALLLLGFAGALRRSELVALRVEDVAVVAGGLRLRVRASAAEPGGPGAAVDVPRGRDAETCPERAFLAWQAMAQRKAGPLFRKVGTTGRIGDAALHPDAVRRILAARAGSAGLDPGERGRLSAHALRAGFIAAAAARGMGDADIMRHTRHRDLRTMRGAGQRAGPADGSPAGAPGA